MFKKLLALCLAIFMVAALGVSLASCGNTEEGPTNGDDASNSPLPPVALNADFELPEDFKVGFILLHDEDSTYDLNFYNAALTVQETLGLSNDQVLFKMNIPESNACYDAAKELVEKGCDIIFADSFGHESFLKKAAEDYPNVQFCHATGTMAHTAGLDNFHNAFASIYEGRYLAGVAAGMKLNEMIANGKITAEQAKMGYVGAFTYAEVISGYTSFYLGAKSVCPSVTMDVQFTGSWYDEAKEKTAAIALMDNGCVLISQHADSMGAPTACEERDVPNVSYNGSTVEACPDTFIVSSKIDWAPYYMYMIKCVATGQQIADDWCGDAKAGSVVLSDITTKAAAAGTVEKLTDVAAKIKAGELHVFDVSTFTVTVVTEGEFTKNVNAKVDANGHLTSYMADVDYDEAFAADTEVVADGYFHESEYRAAPYFDLQIDGITLLNAEF